MPKPVVLTIAGFDPSSGAGITADIKTAAAHDCYAAACITVLTVQSTAGVRRVEAVSGGTVRDTLAELAADLDIAAVRIGMLASGEVACAVADFLRIAKLPNIVFDPIVRASSGAALLDENGRQVARNDLLALADVVTPNLIEAALLTGIPVRDPGQMRAAAAGLHRFGAKAVVVTGGHLSGNETLEVLSDGSGAITEIRGERIASSSTHGTGCAFAMALACNLALGMKLRGAVAAA